MGAFGNKLRREREMRGVTLGEISESTKISKRWLQALEEEQFDVLPGGVFNRGFVRSYARFLGIDEDQAVADYAAASDEQPPAEDKFPLEIHEKPDSPPLNPKRSCLPVVLAIVALVVVVGGWTWWVKRKPPTSAHTPQASPQNAAQPISPTAPTVSTPQSGNSADKSAPAEPQPPSTVTNQSTQLLPNNNPEKAAPAKDKAETAPADKNKASNLGENLTKSFIVFIKAKEDSWVSIVADGKTAWEGTLDANKERSIQAARELVVKTGNAGGLDISYNGKPLGALGHEKQVRTFTFNTAGLQQ
jgi:cytoskeleton protein RodZ